VSDLAIGDREYRDVPVGVRGPSRNDSAFGGVLEHHDAGLDVVMDREVVTPVKDDQGRLNPGPMAGRPWRSNQLLLRPALVVVTGGGVDLDAIRSSRARQLHLPIGDAARSISAEASK